MRREIGNIEYDTDNISGAKLAEIGKWAITGKDIVEQGVRAKAKEVVDRVIGLTDIDWLNNRVEEVCKRGRL